MDDSTFIERSISSELFAFWKHLRLNYQIFILSGSYLAGGVFSPRKDLSLFIIEYIGIHLFLFAGATVYNSFWDKDEGPVGGLYNPPEMSGWMLKAAWLLQFIGFAVGVLAGWKFLLLYVLSTILFWMYSSPLIRLKTKPVLAIISMGLAAGAQAFLMGYYAFGGNGLSTIILLGSLGTTLVIAGLYPFSASYQLHDDAKKGDRTFCVAYGHKGVKVIFMLLYPLGLLMMGGAFYLLFPWAGLAYILLGMIVGILVWGTIARLKMDRQDYQLVMRIKYGTSIANIIFILGVFLFI